MTIIEQRIEGHVAIVIINRPEKRNALPRSAVAELTSVIQDVTTRPETRGLVLTGTGGAFCAGADLTSVLEGTSRDTAALEHEIEAVPQKLIRSLVTAPVPTVAAIDGPAIGMGLDIALACDMRLIGPDGWLMQGWGRIGLIPGTGGVLLLRQLNGSLLWKLLAEQPRLDGAEAEKLGLGERIAGSALDPAVSRMQAIAAMPRRAVDAYITLQRQDLMRALDPHLAECTRAQALLLGDADFGSRVGAFVSPKA